MEVRIGITDSPREISFESKEDTAAVRAKLASALEGGSGLLEFEDVKGSTYLVPASKVAYVELGADTQRKVGFVA